MDFDFYAVIQKNLKHLDKNILLLHKQRYSTPLRASPDEEHDFNIQHNVNLVA